MARVLSVRRSFPAVSYPQSKYTDEVAGLLHAGPDDPADVPLDEEQMRKLHKSTSVQHRYAPVTLTKMCNELQTFTAKNDLYIQVSTDLMAKAVADALEEAGLQPEDVDHIFSVTITGMSNPSLEGRLINRLHGFRKDVKRTPIWGVGCVGGEVVLGRAMDYLQGHPEEIALAVSVELYSLAVRFDDLSTASLVATGLFGDACVAVVLAGDKCKRGTVPRPALQRAAMLQRVRGRSHSWASSGSFRGFGKTLRALDRDGKTPVYQHPKAAVSSGSDSDGSDTTDSSATDPEIHEQNGWHGIPGVVLENGIAFPLAPPPLTILPKLIANRSFLYADSERLIGWDISSEGFKINLSPNVAEFIRTNAVEDIKTFLSDHGLTAQDMVSFVCHPGGPKILQTVREELGMDDRVLELTWKSLADFGNCSSASALMVLEDTMRLKPGKAGEHSLLAAFGPGFTVEVALLRWG